MDQTKKEEFLGKISGSHGMKTHYDYDGLSETTSLGNMIRETENMLSEQLNRRLSSSQQSLQRRTKRQSQARQSRVMAGISVDKVIYSNRVSLHVFKII